MNDATNHVDNPFWRYSLKQYQQPGAEPFFLNCQDQYGLDINLLLYAGWLGTQQRALNIHLPELDAILRWQKNIVQPIRSARRASKSLCTTGDLLSFRSSLKQLELSAEQLQQKKLWSITAIMEKSNTPIHQLIMSNLKQIVRDLGPSNWKAEFNCGKENDETSEVGLWIQEAVCFLNPTTQPIG